MRKTASKLSRDYGDVEYREQYVGEQPRNGLHRAELVDVVPHEGGQSDSSVQWTFHIFEGPYKGWTGRKYTNDEGAAWVEQQILVALGLMKPNGRINLTWDQIVERAKPLRIRTVLEEYEGEDRASINGFLAGLGDDDEGEEEAPATRRGRRTKPVEDEPEDGEDDELEDDEEGEPEDEEEEEPVKPAARSRRASQRSRASGRRTRRAEPEPEEEDEEGEEDGEEDEEANRAERRARRGSRSTSRSPRSSARARGRSQRAKKEEDEDDEPPF